MVHVFGMNWSPQQDPSHNVRRPSRSMTHHCRASHALRKRRCPFAGCWLMLCASRHHASDVGPQVDAERTYMQKLERLGKLTVHPTPCAGHRACDEVGGTHNTAAMTLMRLATYTSSTGRPCCRDRAWSTMSASG